VTTEWVITYTFDLDPDMDQMDAWETGLSSFDATVARIPDRGVVDVVMHPPAGISLDEAVNKTAVEVQSLIMQEPVGVEVVTEAEWLRRAAEPTLPELMSAAEIAEELGVARQRVHQLRSTAAFPAPLAELRGGAVWDARAVRKFAKTWARRPGRPPGREPRRMTYRNSDGRMIDLEFLENRGISLTKADIDSMSPEELDKIIREVSS
jgi:hypothetical protein